jgi:glycosyltransferase involved in cell wall biosynthesis
VKIVHALGWYFPESLGGTEVYVAGLCRRLRSAGHNVAIVAPHTGGERTYEHSGVTVFRYPISAGATRDEAQSLVPARGAERLAEWLRVERPDVFHVHSIVTGLGIFEIEEARRQGARIVLTHHLPSLGYICRAGTLLQWGERACDGICEPRKCAACVLHTRGLPKTAARAAAAMPPALGRRLNSLPGRIGTTLAMSSSIAHAQSVQRRLIRATDQMIVLNQSAKRMLEANGAPPSHVMVNRLGLNHDRARVKAPSLTVKPVRFAFVGRFHRTKGVYELARAIRRIPVTTPFRMEFRGPASSPDDEAVRGDLERMLAADERVTFGPAIEHVNVLDALAEYDVLCCPSTWFENGPTVAIEAMAVGTPVLGTRLGNFPELVEDGVNGRLVAPGDVGELAAALAEIASNPAIVDRWRARIPPPRTMDDVAAEYLTTYAHLDRAVA